MSLLKYACIIDDTSLKNKILDIVITKKASAYKEQRFTKIAQEQPLTDEQRMFLDRNYNELVQGLKSFLYSKQVRGDTAEELIGEGLLEAIVVLPKYWDKKENPDELMRILIGSAKNLILDRLRGFRGGGGESIIVDVEKSHTHKVIPSVQFFLDEALRASGFSDPRRATLEDVQQLLEEKAPIINKLVQEENQRRARKAEELRQSYIAEHGTDDGFKVPQKLRPTDTSKVTSRYRTQWKQSVDPLQQPFLSIEEERQSPGEGQFSLEDTLSEKNLFDLLGFEHESTIPEEALLQPIEQQEQAQMRRERVKTILDVVFEIPVPIRVIMAAAFNVDPKLLQAGNEVEQEMAKISQVVGIDIGDLLTNMKTKAGTRLSWNSVKKIMNQVYGVELLRGMKNHKDFGEKIQGFFTDIVGQLGL